MKTFIILLFTLCVSTAHANKDIYFATKPSHISIAEAVAVLSHVASKQKWTVDELKDNKLRIKLNYRSYRALLIFSFSGHEIRYTDSTTHGVERVPAEVPSRLIRNLKRNIDIFFSLSKVAKGIRGTNSQ